MLHWESHRVNYQQENFMNGMREYVHITHHNVRYEIVDGRARYSKHSEYYCHDCTNYTLTRHGPTPDAVVPGRAGRAAIVGNFPVHVYLSSSSSLARRRAANKLIFINKDHSTLAALACEVRHPLSEVFRSVNSLLALNTSNDNFRPTRTLEIWQLN